MRSAKMENMIEPTGAEALIALDMVSCGWRKPFALCRVDVYAVLKVERV